ncbi:MAG TPA: hypothetical protein VGD88_08190 [Opitutaceae bacterium]
MKSTLIRSLLLTGAVCLAAVSPARADKKNIDAPNDGRIVTTAEPRAEFLVRPDRKVQITFIDQAGKPVPAAGQVVTVTTGDRMNPTQLAFAVSGTVLVSNGTVPAGNNLPTVVQITPTPGAKALVERFSLNFATCPECKHAEYACICDH